MPEINRTPTYALTIGSSRPFFHHPITLTILQQLAQDLTQSLHLTGDSEQVANIIKRMNLDGWFPFLTESLFIMLESQVSYLVLQYPDDPTVWDSEAPDTTDIQPLLATPNHPTILDCTRKLGQKQSNSLGLTKLHESRFIKFVSPFSFDLATYLDQECYRHDRVMSGLENTVSGQGLIKVGIENLFEVLLKGGQALETLVRRLTNLKAANSGDGVLGYDLNREKVDVTPKPIQREAEVLGVIENRISAMTGLPSFIIWGHTDGDGYGVQTSLKLYSQRVGSMSSLCLTRNVTYLCELLSGSDSIWATIQDIYPEEKKDIADRLDKLANSLATLIQVGSITAIEARNTVSRDAAFELVLNPNPVTISPEPNPTSNSESDPTPEAGFQA